MQCWVSKEIFTGVTSSCRDSTLIFRDGRKDAELWVKILSNIHDRSDVTAAIAVIRSRPDSDNRLLREVILSKVRHKFKSHRWLPYLISFVDKLVSTSNEFQAIDMVELRCNLITEEPASATGRDSPSINVLRIAPDEIAEGTLVRNLLSTGDDANLIDSTDFWTKATVNTENLTINDSSQNQEVKDLAARLPDRRVAVLLLTLFVEAVDLSDLAGLVVATDEGDLVRIPCYN